MNIDFGKTAQDYGRYRAGFPDELFTRLARFGIGLPGQRILDLGTGTGTLARGFARRGCMVTGLDPSTPLLEQAKELDKEAGVAITYVVAKAEHTSLPDSSFDVVSAGQCWHWFDRPQAAQEVRRLLVPHGWLVIAHFDWIPLPGNVVEATEKLIERHNPAWKLGGGKGVYPRWLSDVAIAGFQNIETFSFDEFTPYSHEAWRGRIRASAGVAASLMPTQVARFDADLQQLLQERFPEDPLAVHHRVFAVVCQAPLH
ncbi:MAG TPA: methyltransferase domain-containing protein [Methylomirabilota bacterium]|jgi:SAM-dependent methyltransferase|nr:methyltransferase domain-containing protein [Methylomirabilota bacterium]